MIRTATEVIAIVVMAVAMATTAKMIMTATAAAAVAVVVMTAAKAATAVTAATAVGQRRQHGGNGNSVNDDGNDGVTSNSNRMVAGAATTTMVAAAVAMLLDRCNTVMLTSMQVVLIPTNVIPTCWHQHVGLTILVLSLTVFDGMLATLPTCWPDKHMSVVQTHFFYTKNPTYPAKTTCRNPIPQRRHNSLTMRSYIGI